MKVQPTAMDKIVTFCIANGVSFTTARDQLEAAFIRLTLNRTKSQTTAARMLGMHRNTLHRRIQDLGIELPGGPLAQHSAAARGRVARIPERISHHA